MRRFPPMRRRLGESFRGRKDRVARRPIPCLVRTVLLLLLAATQMTPPTEPLAGKLRAAIWDDLQTNGMIGNGNEVAWQWMNFWGYGEDAPELRMSGLVCRGDRATQ